ncbi:MAG: SDR family NAD(P)-dependent oxidoreductase [Alphaproteobacteria bacterium]|nr:SDR family NAD(P)-dependent oxidoreductase [Alphaproteobacteria bacterium]MCW5741539.1 SDR family NAD(P)-dependent oxidoreductase [Alphaproteobacteria bacterium]
MSDELLQPAGRVIAISGASRGIGAAIARRLHADGFTLSLGARDPNAAREALGTHDEARVMVARFEATDAASAQQWIDATLARFGRLDGLINNAGILRMVRFDEGDEAALTEMWNVNVMAPFRLLRLALPHLRKAGHGRVVNIASTDAKRFRDATSSIGYVMTKHAVLALSHAAKFAGWDDGVRVTALCPGAVETGLIAGLAGATPTAGRLKPETIAHTVSFLLSLPDTASVAELPMNTRLESTL